jgi:hypothetical protein
MGRWLAIAMVWAPIVAHAGTSVDRPLPDRPSADQPVATAYAVNPPASHSYVAAADGWALRATLQGRSMDPLQSRDWAADPHVQPHDVEAGWGWRQGGATALIGYESHDFGPRQQQTARALERDPNQPPPVSSPGVLGFSLVLHGR